MSEASEPIVLRPIAATSITYIALAIFFIAIGVLVTGGPLALALSDPTGDRSDFSYLFGLPITIPCLVIGLFLGIRGPGMSAVLTENEAIVHNLFRTVVIPRELVTGIGYRRAVSNYISRVPGIEWRRPKVGHTGGKLTVTVVNFLSPAGVRTRLDHRVDVMVGRLKEWCEAKPASHPTGDIAPQES